MKIKAWGSMLLLSCLCTAATAQKAERYLEKPLPPNWRGAETSSISSSLDTTEADDLFGGQILPIDDRWWKIGRAHV